MATTKQSTADIVREVANEYGVPEWVWRPIMLHESGGNPGSWNDPKENGGKEDSRGLFQINLKAHPQWKNLDLFDPKVNARIAFPNFIAPAWNKVKNEKMNAPDKTAYVWRYGIRPKWTDAKSAAIKETTIKVMTDLQKSATPPDALQPGKPIKWDIGIIDPFRGMFGDKYNIAPGAPGTPGGMEPGIKEEMQNRADRLENDPDILTLIPGNYFFPGIHMKRATLFNIALWTAGVVAVIGFLFIISRNNTMILKQQPQTIEGGET